MLRELRVTDLAVVDELTLEFGPGLSVLTGETGTGKSLFVDALGLLVGGRPSTDLIRTGSARALVEGRFEVSDSTEIRAVCEEAGVEWDDEALILRRELRREGRHRAWVNRSPATTGLLRDLGRRLLDLHGQHEHQRLLDRTEQRKILDAFGGHLELAARLTSAHDALRDVREKLDHVRRAATEGRERADYLRFKAEEIEGAALEPDEGERLAVESRRLENSEELIELASRLSAELYEADEAIVGRLGRLGRPLADVVAIDESSRGFIDLHESALRTLEELGREIGRYLDGVEHDPERLAEIRERQDLIYRLERKYGGSVESIIRAGEEARRELDSIEGVGEETRRLELERSERAAEVERLGRELTGAREQAASNLREAVEASLAPLGLEGGTFEIHLEPLDEIARHGCERIEFRISLNPGFPPASLSRVASGGEMSRLMLALKTALVAVDDVPILVFDEVDAGIGGEIARRVAERLVRVSARHQVLVVTHLAQIAARADAHYSVDKRIDGGEPHSVARMLAAEDRVEELARMLGGDPGSARSRAHAEELLSR